MRKDWAIELLGTICENLDSQRKPITQRDRIAGDIPYYGATGIVDYVKDHLFNEKLVLLGEDGAKWGAGEKCSFTIEGKAWVNNHAHVLRPDRKIALDEWIVYNLNFQDLRPYISGMTVPKLNQGRMNEIKIPLPPLPEQKRIIAILDKAFVAIDKAKSNTKKNLQNAKELFESYLRRVFAEKGKGREEKKLGDIGKVSMCKRVFKEQTLPSGDIPFYKIGTFGKISDAYISNTLYEEYRNKFSFPKKGDILISASGTIGRRVRYNGEPAYFQDSNIVWIENDEKQVLNDYLYHFYAACKWTTTRGATILRLYNDNLKQIEITFPKSHKEQQAIVRQLDTLQNQTQKLESYYRQKFDTLEELKKIILQKAFSGELTAAVVKPYITDKPASSIAAEPESVYKIAANELSEDEKLQMYFICLNLFAHKDKPEEATLAEVKMEKMCHLAEYTIPELKFNREPVKEEYGPADFKRLYRLHDFAEANNIFTYQRSASYKKYPTGDEFMKWVTTALKNISVPVKRKITKLLDVLRPLNTRKMDILATTYAAWNNLIMNKNPVSLAAIAKEGRWHPRKNDFADADFEEAVGFLKLNNLVPEGKGKPVKDK
jgi:type I restriction enzyme S subunit